MFGTPFGGELLVLAVGSDHVFLCVIFLFLVGIALEVGPTNLLKLFWLGCFLCSGGGIFEVVDGSFNCVSVDSHIQLDISGPVIVEFGIHCEGSVLLLRVAVDEVIPVDHKFAYLFVVAYSVDLHNAQCILELLGRVVVQGNEVHFDACQGVFRAGLSEVDVLALVVALEG